MNRNEGANATNHIDKLPTEILRDILVLGSLHSSPSVSRRWRSMALAETRLWSNISIIMSWRADDWKETENGRMRRVDQVEIDRASLWLTRSKNALLGVYILFWGVPEWVQDQVKEIVFPHLHRCRSLRLAFPQVAASPDFINYPEIWFPLPSMPDLDDLYIWVDLGSRYDGKAVDVGPPLTLRKFRFQSGSGPVFLLKIRATEELQIEGCNDETIINILEHCTDVKHVEMVKTTSLLPPFSRPLSFPSLSRLDVDTVHRFPIQAAPNLRQLRFRGSFVDWRSEFASLSRDIAGNLRVLFLPDDQLFSFSTVGNGGLVHFERLKVLWIASCPDPSNVAQSLISPILPSSSQSHFAAERRPAKHMTFPGLKLLIVHGALSAPRDWPESIFGLVQDLLRARSSLIILWSVGSPPPGFHSTRFEEFANLTSNRFIPFPSLEVVERLIKDFDIE